MRTLEAQINWFGRVQLALAGVMVIAIAGFYFSWYRPSTKHWRDLHADIDSKNQVLDLARSKAGELPVVSAEVDRLRHSLEHFDNQIPRKPDLPDFMLSLENLRQSAGIPTWVYNPQDPKRIEGYWEQIIHAEFDGDFPSIATFVSQIEQMDRLTRVRRVSLRTADPDKGAVHVQMDVSIFFMEP